MNKPLRSKLEALGFVKVTYSTETFINTIAGKKIEEEATVLRGKPETHGWHKNVAVVYDCLGEPWVRASRLSGQELRELGLHENYSPFFKANAHVPHVGDSGEYLKARYDQFKDVDIPLSKPRPR
jgi:hypothetical protein